MWMPDVISQSYDFNFYCRVSIYWLMILVVDNYRFSLIIPPIYNYDKMLININLLCIVIKP